MEAAAQQIQLPPQPKVPLKAMEQLQVGQVVEGIIDGIEVRLLSPVGWMDFICAIWIFHSFEIVVVLSRDRFSIFTLFRVFYLVHFY